MITVIYGGVSYSCTKAIKGSDYIHLVDDNGCMVASFDGVTNFNAFTISGGSWTTPAAVNDCYVGTVGDDGVIRKSSVKLCDLASESYVSSAISGAITTALNTEV